MPLLTSKSLLRENRENSKKILPPVSIEPLAQDYKSSMPPPTLTGQLLLRRSLNFCSCKTWFLDLDDLIRINRAWLYKDPKGLDLKAIAQLVRSSLSQARSLRKKWRVDPNPCNYGFYANHFEGVNLEDWCLRPMNSFLFFSDFYLKLNQFRLD